MKDWLYKWLPIIFGCHCKEERSFHYKGEKFPICARCTGELVGIVFALVSCFFFRPSIPVCIVLMLPMIVDGFVQRLTSYESTNPRRFVTGVLFGYALFIILIITTIMTFEWGFTKGLEWFGEYSL